MNLNEFAISTFKSNYLKNYLTSINHEFTIEEMITIILNSDIVIENKFKILNRFYNKSEIECYKSEIEYNSIINELNIILEDYEYIKLCLNGAYDSIILFFNELDETKCLLNFDLTKKLMQELNICKNNSITIIDGKDSSEVAYVDIDENYNIISYTLCKPVNGYISKLYNKYVDIPNDIKIGDIVKIYDDSNEYVVVAESNIPDKLKKDAEYNIDSCITVIPKYSLDSNIKYKEQVEELLRNRIKNINTDELDIITLEHEHVHLSFVDKMEANI